MGVESAKWDRLFRDHHPWDITSLGTVGELDGALPVDIELMNEIARLLEVTHMAPVVANPLIDRDLDAFPSSEIIQSDLFHWDVRERTLQEPRNLRALLDGIEHAQGLHTFLIILWKQEGGTKAPADFFDLITVDTDRRVITRSGGQVFTTVGQDPAQGPMVPLDFATDALDQALCALFEQALPGYAMADQAEIQALLEPLRDALPLAEFIQLTLPSFQADNKMVLKMWTWWLHLARLNLPELDHATVLRQLTAYVAAHPERSLGDVILNFYPFFTGNSSFHVFGDKGFVADNPLITALPLYEQGIVAFMARLSRVPKGG
jgi:hypothetical protein